MFDLSNISTVCDVSVKVTTNSPAIDLHFSPGKEMDLSRVRAELEAIGLTVYGCFYGCFDDMQIGIFTGNYDKYQLAERIAMGMEDSGLRVRRLVTPLEKERRGGDASATKEIQSFILA
jgi:hypothetical protein